MDDIEYLTEIKCELYLNANRYEIKCKLFYYKFKDQSKHNITNKKQT